MNNDNSDTNGLLSEALIDLAMAIKRNNELRKENEILKQQLEGMSNVKKEPEIK